MLNRQMMASLKSLVYMSWTFGRTGGWWHVLRDLHKGNIDLISNDFGASVVNREWSVYLSRIWEEGVAVGRAETFEACTCGF